MTCASGGQRFQSHGAQMLGRWCACRREALEDGDDVGVARDHPGVQVRVPVYGVLLAQLMIERIGVGQHLWIQQLHQAQDLALFTRLRRCFYLHILSYSSIKQKGRKFSPTIGVKFRSEASP